MLARSLSETIRDPLTTPSALKLALFSLQKQTKEEAFCEAFCSNHIGELDAVEELLLLESGLEGNALAVSCTDNFELTRGDRTPHITCLVLVRAFAWAQLMSDRPSTFLPPLQYLFQAVDGLLAYNFGFGSLSASFVRRVSCFACGAALLRPYPDHGLSVGPRSSTLFPRPRRPSMSPARPLRSSGPLSPAPALSLSTALSANSRYC